MRLVWSYGEFCRELQADHWLIRNDVPKVAAVPDVAKS